MTKGINDFLSSNLFMQVLACIEFTMVFSHLYLSMTRFQNPLHVYWPNIWSTGEVPKDRVMMLSSPTETGVTVVTFNKLAAWHKRQFAANSSGHRDLGRDHYLLWKTWFGYVLIRLATLSPLLDVIGLQKVRFRSSYIMILESDLAAQ